MAKQKGWRAEYEYDNPATSHGQIAQDLGPKTATYRQALIDGDIERVYTIYDEQNDGIFYEVPERLAFLTAAAPTLLAACEAALEWLGRFAEHAPIAFGGEVDLDITLTAAINKAKGVQ